MRGARRQLSLRFRSECRHSARGPAEDGGPQAFRPLDGGSAETELAVVVMNGERAVVIGRASTSSSPAPAAGRLSGGLFIGFIGVELLGAKVRGPLHGNRLGVRYTPLQIRFAIGSPRHGPGLRLGGRRRFGGYLRLGAGLCGDRHRYKCYDGGQSDE